MLLVEITQMVLEAAGTVVTCDDQGATCPTASFTAIGAAFATQGFFVQADLLWYLINTKLGLWAPLIYLLAAASGIVGVAIGMPPRNYIWFFIGPALFHWLLQNQQEIHGVEWRVAGIAQDQREVWKLAEVGLTNLNIRQRLNGQIRPSADKPAGKVAVASFFLDFDKLVTSTVQWMIKWTGIYRQADGKGAGGSTNIVNMPSGAQDYDRWYLLSNLKWGLLENITSARLHSGDIRDAFVTFLSSECGDAMSKQIDKSAIIAASNSRTARLPSSVFVRAKAFVGPTIDPTGTAGSDTDCSGDDPGGDYDSLLKVLVEVPIPIPRSTRDVWTSRERGSFSQFFNKDPWSGNGQGGGFWDPSLVGPVIGGGTGDNIQNYFQEKDNLNCADFLYFVVNGFRWEAGQIYHQLVTSAPNGMKSAEVIYNILYGWAVKDSGNSNTPLNDEKKREHFIKDLILIHLFKNELSMAPKIVDKRFSSVHEQSQVNAETYLANVGSKTKYAEVYTWALMIPYIQGVLLYLLAMAYPFACLMILVPGMHKTLFTWMVFWAWVRLWDVGFAVVTVLERSIWAMLGNNTNATRFFSCVVPMQGNNFGKVIVESYGSSGGTGPVAGGGDALTIPNVYDETGYISWENLMRIFDRSMLLGAAMDLDLQNAYYIYIMAALYFAVPAVTGQLVLGAKAGAAGMVQNMIGGTASDAGRAAGQGFTAQLSKGAAANAATVNQEAYAKGMRKGGFADQAIAASNMQLESGLAGAENSALSAGIDHMRSNLQRRMDTAGSSNTTAGALFKGLGTPGGLGFLGLMSAGRSKTADQIKELVAPLIDRAFNGEKPSPDPQPASSGAAGARASAGGGSRARAGIAGTGATGAGPTGGGATGGVWELLAGMAGTALHYGVDAGTGLVQNQLTRGYNQRFAGMQGQQAAAGINAFQANAEQSGYGVRERRIGSQAEFGAQMDAWRARRDFGVQASGYLGAMGMDTSFLSPGNKPTDMMGMAMSGMLGSSARSLANYASDGGAYFSRVGSSASWLREHYGQQSVQGAYADTSLGQAATRIGDSAGTVGVSEVGGLLAQGIEAGGAASAQMKAEKDPRPSIVQQGPTLGFEVKTPGLPDRTSGGGG